MSRMDRYYNENTSSKRSQRNQDLYRTIYDDNESYSNIEGIATIDKSNEVDISKVKDMLKSREDFMKQKELRTFIPKEQEEIKYETFERDDDRVYDIRDILNKAREKKEEQKYHNLDQKNLELLQKLKEHPKTEKEQVNDIVEEIHNTSELHKLTNQDLGLDMFDELKSDNNTMLGDKASVKAILDEAKKEDKKEQTSSTLDKSFYTSSMKFNDEDFEGFEDTKSKVSIWQKVILFILLIAVSVAVVFIVFNLLK